MAEVAVVRAGASATRSLRDYHQAAAEFVALYGARWALAEGAAGPGRDLSRRLGG